MITKQELKEIMDKCYLKGQIAEFWQSTMETIPRQARMALESMKEFMEYRESVVKRWDEENGKTSTDNTDAAGHFSDVPTPVSSEVCNERSRLPTKRGSGVWRSYPQGCSGGPRNQDNSSE